LQIARPTETSAFQRSLIYISVILALMSAGGIIVVTLALSLSAQALANAFPLSLVLTIGLVCAVLPVMAVVRLNHVFEHVRESVEQTAQVALVDTLSGLPNRRSFMIALDKNLLALDPDGAGIAVMFLDLDRFKEVNDRFGHAAGDRLICAFADRIRARLRGSDVLARFGGDEFAIIQTNVKGVQDAEALAKRVLEATSQGFQLDEAMAHVGVSIGISLAHGPRHSVDDLMRQSDIALYRAKNDGRNRYMLFEAGMDTQIQLRKIVEDDLRQAIETDRLELYYQPQVTAFGAEITSFEALVRWRHPVRGYIPPSDFIPLAEASGLVMMLGDWVMRRACADAVSWPSKLGVAVNVSPIQFKQPDFVARVGEILAETGLDPHRLEVELTEGVLIDDADAAESAIIDLRAMGVRVALDDFGTGYSSLIYLRRFAFDKIKIDRGFLESLEATGESAIIVHSVVHLGRALGLTVTAEGVETVEQQRLLQSIGCHLLQGYLFSRPVPLDDALKLLAGPSAAASAA
jgi:diguanylate cyclase (GGDEF)-like protein